MSVPLTTMKGSTYGSVEEGETGPGSSNALGYVMGVFIPCVLGVYGVIIFLRLSWLVGQSGLILFIGIMTMAYLVVFLTVLSLGAIVTNGVMKGGGAYFSFSRTLGPELGGAIGLIFYGANVTGCAFYLVGLTDALQAAFPQLPQDRWFAFALGSAVLALLTVVSIVGANAYAKTALFIFTCLLVTVAIGFVAICVQPAGTVEGFTSWSMDTLNSNLWPEFSSLPDDEPQSLNTQFGIFFPTVTGILAGSNMSGDLADPAKSIPKGTFLAMLFTYVSYLTLAIAFAATTSRETLQKDYFLMQNVTFSEYIIVYGIMCSTMSSCLNNQIGGSRIFQALCKDNIFPFIHFFGVGSAGADEPRRAVMLSWFICQILLIIAEVNLLAEVITMFFLISYIAINLACFGLAASGVPNFRPSFDMSNWGTAGAGVLVCFVTIFYTSPLYALFSLLILVMLVIGVSFRTTDVAWGDLSQAVIYHQVRKWLLRLRVDREHLKYWRPQLLVLTSNPHVDVSLLDFCNKLKKGGLYVIGNVLTGEKTEELRVRYMEEENDWRGMLESMGLKAFHQATISASVRDGISTMLEMTGLGAMRPNTVVLGHKAVGASRRSRQPSPNLDPSLVTKTDPFLASYKEGADGTEISLDDYVGVISDALVLGKNVLVSRNFDLLDHKYSSTKAPLMPPLRTPPRHDTIDVWSIDRALGIQRPHSPASTSFSCALLLGHILRSTPAWGMFAKLRVISVVANEGEKRVERDHLTEMLRLFRISAEIEIVVLPSVADNKENGPIPSMSICNDLNGTIRTTSGSASVILTTFGMPKDPVHNDGYLAGMAAISEGLPPSLCILGTKDLITVEM